MSWTWDGRVVVVTGGARGIGRAVAEEALAAGASVATCDRDGAGLAALAAAGGDRVLTSVLDVRDRDAVAAFAGDVAGRWGGVDGLVNNAGGTFRSDVVDVAPRGVDALVAENFTSVVAVTTAFAPVLRRGGAVVNVTSSEAHQAAPGFGVYAAMKAAQEQLTRTLALELADDGVRVNSVAPDGIPTDGDAPLAEEVRASSPWLPPAVPPLGRTGHPDECAQVVLFLLSGAASFVTGTCVHVDGGLWAAGGWHRRPVDGPAPAGG